MDINKAMSKCFKNGVIVYPVYNQSLKCFNIQRKLKENKPYTYEKPLKQNEVNNALIKVYIHLAKKL